MTTEQSVIRRIPGCCAGREKGRLILCLMLALAVAAAFLPMEQSLAASKPGKVGIASVKKSGSKITVKWKKVSGAKGYQILIARKGSSGYGKVYKKATTKKALTTGKLPNGKYRIKVRAFKKQSGKKVYGKWSAAKYLTLANTGAADTSAIQVDTSDGTVSTATDDGITTVSLTAAGTYTLSGDCTNTRIEIAEGLSGVTVNLNGLTIDNSGLTSDEPAFAIGKKTGVTLQLTGSSAIKGSGACSSEAAKGLIYQKGDTSTLTITGSGSLALTDSIGSDAIRSKGTVTVKSGTLKIDVYGDGIQAETLDIQGGTMDIATHYANAGLNYYNTALASTALGGYNTMSSSETSSAKTKVEKIYVDTGSHKGLKAGSKAKTYSYTVVEDGSDYTAGQAYPESASGGLTISGGAITVDTTDTGIKYNGNGGSGNLTVADDGKIILGAPEDAIKSNNDCTISGGTITVKSADDGISVAGTLNVTGSAKIDVQQAFEGIEASTINVGTGSDSPEISVYTNDDGINAAGKSSVTYVYADETEAKYTKTSVSSMTGHDMTVNSGSVTVTIGDDESHSYSLPVATGYGVVSDGSTYTGTYFSNGDGIDCNGSFYAKGGSTVIWGPLSGDNSPVDTADSNSEYVISSGAEILAAGSSGGMANNPTSLGQAAVVFSGSQLTKNKTMTIKDSAGSSTLFTATAPKALTYVMYSSPKLTSGSSYTLYSDSSQLASATAATTISGGQSGPGFDQGSGGPGGPGGSGVPGN